MAAFFKDYKAQVKAERDEAERLRREATPREYEEGELLYIFPCYDDLDEWGEPKRGGRRYFVARLEPSGLLLLANTPAQARQGVGRVYHESAVQWRGRKGAKA